MATYNRAHLIEETLKSIENQSYKDWECLIIDDGATDNTEEILQKWLQKDSRFKYQKRASNHQKGLPGCRNQGIELAKGDYIIFFDDDDLIHPQNLKICVDYNNRHTVDFLHYEKKPFKSKQDIFFKQYESYFFEKTISRKDVYDSITGKIGLASCTIMWSQKVFKDFKFDETLQFAEEWDLYNRLLINGYTGHKIKNQLYFNRKHSLSNTALYYKHNPEKTKSKIQACCNIIYALDEKKLLNKRYIKFFIGLRKKEESKPIFKTLLKSKSLGLRNKMYLIFRYTFLSQLKYLYALKSKT
jgi:glycosyltransferase involved in cell wall biosynthesis